MSSKEILCHHGISLRISSAATVQINIRLQLRLVLMKFNYRTSIQTTASILGQNINSLVEHLSKHSDFLNRTVVYPSTNFPGRTQEGLLGQLLRKKYEPQVETWVDQGRAIRTEVAEGKE